MSLIKYAIRYENEIAELKKILDREIFHNKSLSEQLLVLQRQNAMLDNANSTLIKSNQSYEQKWQKVHSSLQYYRDFYEKYSDQVPRHGPTKSLASGLLHNLKTPSLHTISNEAIGLGEYLSSSSKTPVLPIEQPGIHQNREDRNNVGAEGLGHSISDRQYDYTKKKPSTAALVDQFELSSQEHKTYLLDLAKDMYLNPNIEKYIENTTDTSNKEWGSNSQQTNQFKRYRSMSNALDYKTNVQEDVHTLALRYHNPRRIVRFNSKPKLKTNTRNKELVGFQFGQSQLNNLDISVIKDAYVIKRAK